MSEETLLEPPHEGQPLPAEKKKAKGEITITFQRWHIYAILMPLVFGLGLGIGYLIWGRLLVGGVGEAVAQANSEKPADPGSAQDSSGASDQVPRYDIPVDDDPAIGSENATITIVEFSDYECPYCRSCTAKFLPS
jgi:hypothetical protein